MSYRFEFRDNTGRICCQSQYLETLCKICRPRAEQSGDNSQRTVTALRATVAAVRKTEAEWRAHYAALLGRSEAPDGYAVALAALAAGTTNKPYPNSTLDPDVAELGRAGLLQRLRMEMAIQGTDPNTQIPDGYAIALDQRKENGR